MQDFRHPKRERFTVVRSGAEDAEMKSDEQNWDNEGGHIEEFAMSHDPGQPFHLLDEPSRLSVSVLTSSLCHDSTTRGVSPKMYAHRSRVIRQQTKLLEAIEKTRRQDKRMRKASRPKDHRKEGGPG